MTISSGRAVIIAAIITGVFAIITALLPYIIPEDKHPKPTDPDNDETVKTLKTTTFAFGGGTPFKGTVDIQGNEVTLDSVNTEPWGNSSFRDIVGASANVTIKFSKPIRNFELTVSRMLAEKEYLTHFNIGMPTKLFGELNQVNDKVTTGNVSDYGSGTLVWDGLNTTVVQFKISSYGAISFDSFGFVEI